MFTTNCTNKGCYKQTTPYLLDNKVFCDLCDKELLNISPFTKNQMKQNKQFKKKESESFAVHCDKCKQTTRPIDTGKDIVCGSCKSTLDKLSSAFKFMLKTELKKATKDI